MSLSATLKARALDIGFDLAGVAPLAACQDLDFARVWVERGFGGEMRYLQNPKRHDPRRILPSARSVVCVGLVYNASLPYSTEASQKLKVKGQESGVNSQESGVGSETSEGAVPVSNTPGARAWISRYAWGRDYHETMRAKLDELRAVIEGMAPEVETRVYVDTGPVVERAFARFSGMGWMGKNTCLINEHKGSWFFIGVVLTSLELEPDLPAPDRCGSCTRCLEACPTGALIQPYVMDASRCISYFTIELKGPIPEQYRERMGANVFGCDICQDVCPWNGKGSDQWSVASGQLQGSHQPRRVATTELREFQPMQVSAGKFNEGFEGKSSPAPDPRPLTPGFSLFNPPLEALASLTQEDFRHLFAHSPIKRIKYRGWLRNLCIAMGNSSHQRFLPWLERACAHEDPLVREHAQWAVARLRSHIASFNGLRNQRPDLGH